MKDSERALHRRRFLGFAGGAALALLPASARSGDNDPPDPEPLPPTRVYPDMPEATVSIRAVGGSVEDAVREAVMAAGGLDEIEPGQTVMIKPNLCGPAIGDRFPGHITTNPEIVRAVVRVCKERGAKVMVGDRAMFWTELAMKTSGFARVCEEEGAVPFPWTRAEYEWFYPGKRHWSRGFRVPKILRQVDHFINLPLLKNHGIGRVDFTCCLKAFVGVALPEDRHQDGLDALHTANISEKIAELNLAAAPAINIVDATEIMIAGGPDGMNPKISRWTKPGLVLASKDRVACDSVALAILKLRGARAGVNLPYVEKRVWDQPQIYYAAELGIGQADPSRIKIEDIKVEDFDEIKDNWKW